MQIALRSGVMLVALAATVPVVFEGNLYGGWRDCCCRRCYHPCGNCVCPTPALQPIPQTTYQPVVETQYAQQPVLQQRDVVATEYRTEPVTETVPSTIYENVMVDEGSYQTVWVPKMTTRAVARTVYQARTSYRTVPYQVTRRVSEYASQTVPYQTVRYVPSTTALSYVPQNYAVSALPYNYARPLVSAVPAPVVASTPATANGLAPVADPRFASAPATPITPRSALTYDDRPSTPNSSDTRSADRGPSLFAPAPSAAQVWRTPRGTMTR